jgi:adenylate kinase
LESTIDKERETFVVDPTKVSEMIKKIEDKKDEIFIIEGHYAVDVIPRAEVSIVFVLRRDPRELEYILQKRGYSSKKIWENINAELLDVCLGDALSNMNSNRICEIDISGKDVDFIVEEITEILNKNKRCSYGKVDWLGKLEAEGQLDDILKNIRLAEQT